MKAMRAALTLAVVVCGCWVYADDSATFELLDAIERGDVEGVKAAVDKGADLQGTIIENYTALALAVDRGHGDIVKTLIAAGSDVNAEAGWYPTALFLAASRGDVPVMKILIENGADVHAEGMFGETALMLVVHHVEAVQLLLDSGADPNAANRDEGWTALMLAVRDGDLEVVKLLLEAGADPDATGGGSQSALDWARAYQKKDIQELLEHYASQR